MTEILTESFCERCGTRYTFESARPRVRLKGVKVLSRGLKNFVLSDDTSIDEAMAAARSEADREASAQQLDAFHKTFSFCMSCRQYTCPNCWNEAEARCLSCAPLALPEVAAEVHDLHQLSQAVLIGEPEPGNGTVEAAEHQHEPWPSIVEQEAEVAAAEAEVAAAEADVAATDVVAEEAAAEAHATATEPEERFAEGGDAAGKAVSQTLGLLRRFRPGQSLDAELDAYEREREDAAATEAPAQPAAATDDLAALQADRLAAASAAEAEALEIAPEPEPTPLAETPTVEAVALEAPAATEAPETVEAGSQAAVTAAEAIEPEAPAAVTEPEPEAAAVTEPEPAPAPAPEEPAEPPIAAAAAADVVEQPTWRITAPDPTAATAPSTPAGKGPVPLQATTPPARPSTGEPQWPARPEWPSATATAAGLPFLGRPATPQGGMDALWAASNQELVTTPPAPGKAASGIQPCISCGLSLSATARFCRRCGTLQSR